ncbi:non-ribosomal peptide synthetase [Microbispora sp. H13382]|uniref:non-ribosomal peptide synthetase n=1 Tax=Microbispora sp. H13382 TaxID=2729112 RepID=UPI001600EF2C|nr:non-ribosomal peptide synthetase [Microbispora sp. H13382]
MSAAEQRELTVRRWNDTCVDLPKGTLAGLFEQQADRTPDAVAVRFDDDVLTYRELDEHANRLAHALIRAGAGPESRVGLCLERSLGLMVAIFGILKSGAAYVPFDPGYPREHLANMAEDAGLVALVTNREQAGLVPAGDAAVLHLDDLAGESPARPGVTVHPASLAYVIFTSGSTGRPKGVMNTHEAVVNRLHWMQHVYPFTASDRILQKTPVSFDVSVWELFGPLLQGATLVMARPDGHREPPYLVRAIAEHGITLVHFVPSMLRALLDEPGLEGRTASLRRVFCSGEALSADLVRRFHERRVAPELLNLYGPTEAAVEVTFFPCPPEAATRAIPIGRPIANATVYVLDEALTPVPIGVSGELYLGGRPLARGYVERPGLTAERFVPSPFGVGERLYRTGDLARWRADGVLEYLGRADDQVKIRGYRIELGEIESVLSRHPAVREAAVAALGEAEDKRLAAYVVPRPGAVADPVELRDHLRAALPDYMVPNWYVPVTALPLSPSGKLDRRALPAPTRDDAGERSADTPLEGAVEHLLAGIWRELLAIPQVYADDDFFSLGGHSLVAARVASHAAARLGVELGVRDVFEAPTVRALARRVERAPKTAAAPVIAPAGDGPQPASYAQRGLWFLDRLDPGGPVYNEPIALDVDGPLDVAALRTALAALAARHAPLRTRFTGAGDDVRQIVDPPGEVPVEVADLRACGDLATAVTARASAEALRPFDLERGPLFRACLLHLADERWVLLLTVHHIVYDGWSFGILLRELGALYGAACRGEDANLAPLPVQYADFAAWQRAHLAERVGRAQLAYWKDRLAGAPPTLDLVTDRVRPDVPRHVGGSFAVTLDAATARRLAEVSHAHGVTRFMTLLAAYQLVLGRHAGVQDVSVGTPASGRTRPELEGLIGYFVNMIVLRTRWEDEPTFAALLERVRETTLGAHERQDVPFEHVVDALNPPRDPRRTPLFQVVLAMANAPEGEADLPGLSASVREPVVRPAKFDLTVTWDETPLESGELRATVDYDADLFDRATVERLMRHYVTLLEAALAAPDSPVSDLPHTTREERALLAAWGSRGATARAGDVLEAFHARAGSAPGAVALTFDDDTLTYAELRARAERLARALGERGVTADSVVGLAMDRSAALVVAMLAVVTAGAAYLPLDLGHPAERLAYMVEDSGACLVLVDREPAFAPGVPVVRLGELDPAAPGAPLPGVHPEQRACVLYTSGSTGRPKGVDITHRGIVRLVCEADYLGFGPSDVVAQVASVSFDAATFEVWGALLNGARLAGIGQDDVLSPDRLRARIETGGVTAMLLTTSLFHLCADADPAMFAPLRTLFFGGEAADARRVAAVRAAAPALRLVNAYGPTEGTTIASTYDVADADAAAPRVPIGRPIAGTGLHVLDTRGRESGVGVPGELHLGGAGLGRGYTGRPGLTAERFVPSPYGVGERLYRTGDVVRWREDGTLDYLGRTDAQVKIRGVRIEPDEIASVLTTCPGVSAAVVDARDGDGGRHLVAYVVADREPAVEPAALRAYLLARLPEAMVPNWYVALPALPLTPNGKVDRRALPAPADGDGVRAGTYVAPRGPAEELVAQVWEDVLGLARVSAHDDFFALGGHSLLAAQVVARVSARLGVGLGVRAIFEAPTVAALAARAGAARGTDAPAPIPPAGPGPHPASFAQRRLWFLDRLVPGSPLYNVPVALDVDGPLDVTALRTALAALAARHPSLRTRFTTDGDEVRQVVEADGAVPMEIADLRGGDAEAAIAAEASEPFDLERGPLLRGRALRVADERWVLLLTVHHIVADGWSMGVLLAELGTLYEAARRGEEARLPLLPIQYADYALWQRAYLADGVGRAQLAYWKDRLAGAPPALDLPTDRPRPPVPRYAGETFPLRLPAALARRLNEVSRAHGVTRFMTLLAAFHLLLGRYAGVTDVSVGTPISGRTRPETAGVVGFFVNTLVLRARWDDEPTFAGFLARVREETLSAYDHQDVPFEQVVEALKPPRDPGRAPLFQVMLAMQDASMSTAELPGLSVSAREPVGRVAKFDLTVAWEEAPLGSGELRGSVEYDVDLFDRETVEGMMRHYLTLLESALAAPETRVSDLAMAGEDELAALLETGTVPGTSGDTTVPALFAAAVARWPERTALRQVGRSLTYAELDARSDAVSAHLRARGVSPGSAVAVWMDRSLAWPVALLGIMKAGAAYVPVDVHGPRERAEHVLRDSAAVLVLGSRATGAPPDCPVPFAAVEEIGEQPAIRVPYAAHPAGTAYILYTSGTTGRPKGVCVGHANLAHTLQAVADRYALEPDDRVLQFAALTFDVAAEELFATLIRGAAVVLPPVGPAPGIEELTTLVREERLSVLNLPASYWHEWVSVLVQHPPAACPSLRLVVVGSERVDGGKLAEWQAAAPGHVRWLNAYGPTETTITATVHEPPPAPVHGTTVPIGRPLPGVRAYVLDAALRPVPRGVPGDLYLAGAGVSQGYLGDPARTAGHFLPDPWGAPGDRMYATGDRARRGAGGVLEFLGRGDDQIKLRGFRIELGEVEAALAAHPAVGEAAAVLREDTPGRPMLVGYVTLADGATAGDVRGYLAGRLPGYMVPGMVVVLDRLPRGERGKIDRRALPAPARDVPRGAGELRGAVAGEMESAVASIWRDVLALDHVGADDNFFELGGHSLLIVRVQSRLSALLGTKVPVVELFRFPTVRTLARHLAAGDGPAGGSAGRRRAEARRTRQAERGPRRRATTPRDVGDMSDD